MNRIGMNAFAAAAFLLAAPMVLFAATSDEQTILRLERELSTANVHGDISTLDRMVANDYVGIEAIGRIETKTGWLDSIKSEALVVDAEEPSQMKVRMYGNVAIVTGHLSVRDKRGNKAGHHEITFTDIWVKRDGRWQVVNYQGTMMAQ